MRRNKLAENSYSNSRSEVVYKLRKRPITRGLFQHYMGQWLSATFGKGCDMKDGGTQSKSVLSSKNPTSKQTSGQWKLVWSLPCQTQTNVSLCWVLEHELVLFNWDVVSLSHAIFILISRLFPGFLEECCWALGEAPEEWHKSRLFLYPFNSKYQV